MASRTTLQRPIPVSEPQAHPTPYVRMDLPTLRAKARAFNEALPGIGVYYAVKANDNRDVVLALDPLVTGYDVASLTEIEYLMSLGVAPERLRYSNPVKIPSHIAGAYGLGVTYFAFDSISEIDKVAANAPGSSVYLRLDVSNKGSRVPLSSKFGADPADALKYCKAAQAAGLTVAGITFHVGSQSEDTGAWPDAIALAGRVIGSLNSAGIRITFLNIGGGFPADYGNGAPALADVATAIKGALVAHVPPSVAVIAEPGRYLVAEAGSLVTTVIGRETRGTEEWLYLDMGRFQGLTELFEMPGFLYPVRAGEAHAADGVSFTLTGPSCDSFDTIGKGYVLPADMKVGDTVIIDSAGAYTFVYGSTFNGFSVPQCIISV